MNATSNVSTVSFAPKHLSGIDVVDGAWGGLYRGGSYLVYGRAASGRGLLTLTFAHTGAQLGEPVLFVSPDRHKDLMIQAASIGFNLRESYENGIVRLMRVPPLMNLQNMGDDGVAGALWDLVNLIRQHRPTRLIMNDFMPFVAFRSFDRFRNEFIQFLEQIDSLETTMMLVMPEPANQQSKRVIEFMASQMTGSMHIELADDNPTTTKRRITLIPHIGHIKRQVVDYWDLEDLIQTANQPQSAKQSPVSAPSRPSPEDTLPAWSDESSTDLSHAPDSWTPDPSAPSTVPGSTPTTVPSPFAQPPSPFAPPSQSAPMPPAQAPPRYQAPPPVQPQPPVHQAPPPAVPDGETEHSYSDRSAFTRRLQGYFAARSTGADPFLLLALRMDRPEKKTARPFDFDFLMDLVREELRRGDDMLVDAESERLIVLLGNSRSEQAQRFFARLKDRLRKESPVQADHLLHAVSAIVVPDGTPFDTAEEFLNYALDEA
jgi:archaellum biogenesis ATPase FlaH